ALAPAFFLVLPPLVVLTGYQQVLTLLQVVPACRAVQHPSPPSPSPTSAPPRRITSAPPVNTTASTTPPATTIANTGQAGGRQTTAPSSAAGYKRTGDNGGATGTGRIKRTRT